jgi:hypothetical protein
MGLADDLAEIECEECGKLAIEDFAEFVTDPGNLARLDPEEAEEMRQYLGKLLNRPDDTLKQLVRALASKAKESVGVYEQ